MIQDSSRLAFNLNIVTYVLPLEDSRLLLDDIRL